MKVLFNILFSLLFSVSSYALDTCASIQLQVNPQDIQNVSCTSQNDGKITFTVSNGSSNNLFRIRKKNLDGSLTTITFPAYSPVGNLQGENKTVTFSGLMKGDYDLYVYCNEDPSKFKVQYFTIGKESCSGESISYTCSDLALSIIKTNVKPVSCSSDNDGSVMFTVSGGFPNNLYRLRKKNLDGSFSIVSSPIFSPVNNLFNEATDVVLNGLSVGEYDLYVYCSSNSNVYKSISFNVTKSKCTLVQNGLLAHYPFNGNSKDEQGNKPSGIVSGATQAFDNFKDPKGAYLLDGIDDKITFPSLIDIDTINEYSIAFWCNLQNLPNSGGATLMSIPNGRNLSRFNLSVEKNGLFKVRFGKGIVTKNYNTKTKLDTLKWNHIVVTHSTDSNKIYINNKLIGTYPSSEFNSNFSDLIVGFEGKKSSCKFIFDEFRVYNRTLTSTEIETIYLNEARENCNSILLTVGSTTDKTLSFTVANGSANNKYRIRKKGVDGIFTSIYASQFLSLNNYIGETTTTILDLEPGVYDIFAYCGTDGSKYQGYEVLVRENKRPKLLRLTNTNETVVLNEEEQNQIDIESTSLLQIYPNPASSYVTLQFSQNDSETNNLVTILNTNGQTIKSFILDPSIIEKKISIEDLEPGLYFVICHSETQIFNKVRLVVY